LAGVTLGFDTGAGLAGADDLMTVLAEATGFLDGCFTTSGFLSLGLAGAGTGLKPLEMT